MLEHLEAEPLGIFKSSLPVKRNSLAEQFHGHTISLFAVRIATGLAKRNGINRTVAPTALSPATGTACVRSCSRYSADCSDRQPKRAHSPRSGQTVRPSVNANIFSCQAFRLPNLPHSGFAQLVTKNPP